MTKKAIRILCVEDEAMLREDIVLELRDTGYEVVETGDGMAALALALSEDFDLVICDMRLPQLDGLGVLAELRRGNGVNSCVPFLLLTAFDDPGLRERCKQEGVLCLLKPIDYEHLQDIVKRIVDVDQSD